MDKFPEAFRRFEQRVDVDRIESFRQLNMAFGSFAGQKWVPTRRQMDALAIEAQKCGIPTYGHRRERPYSSFRSTSPITWQIDQFNIRGKIRHQYRDTKTGRFIKKPQ